MGLYLMDRLCLWWERLIVQDAPLPWTEQQWLQLVEALTGQDVLFCGGANTKGIGHLAGCWDEQPLSISGDTQHVHINGGSIVPSFPCESGHSYNVRKTEHRPTNSVRNGPGNNMLVFEWK